MVDLHKGDVLWFQKVFNETRGETVCDNGLQDILQVCSVKEVFLGIKLGH